MGQRGPAPKDPATRQRRNRDDAARNLVDTNPLPEGEVPALTDRLDGDGEVVPWTPIALEYWRELWSSPMATQWTRSDVYRVWLYLDAFDRYASTRSSEWLTEVRLQGSALGIVPMDRRRLGWTTRRPESSDEARAKPVRQRARPSNPSAVLTAVK